MKKLILFLSLALFISSFIFIRTTKSFSNQEELRIGGKIHFEEESASDYIGIKEINKITRNILHELFDIKDDSCAPNAKILLLNKDGAVKITHYEEKSRPGIGEEMHNTLLYTSQRGFCDSETLEQVRDTLFGKCKSPLTHD